MKNERLDKRPELRHKPVVAFESRLTETIRLIAVQKCLLVLEQLRSILCRIEIAEVFVT